MALIEAAQGAIRTKDSALAARYRRVMRHRGHKKALVAVAHAMLRAVYHVLAEGTPTATWAPTTTTGGMRTGSPGGPSNCWNVKATVWCSNRRHKREPLITRYFLGRLPN